VGAGEGEASVGGVKRRFTIIHVLNPICSSSTHPFLFHIPQPDKLMLLQWVGETWPSMPDGKPYHGKNLFTADFPWRKPLQPSLGRPTADLGNRGEPKYKGSRHSFNRQRLQQLRKYVVLLYPYPPSLNTNHISANLRAKGIYLKISDKYDLITRLARGDVNIPDFDSFQIKVLAPEARFEAAVYHLLQSKPYIRPSRLLYSRVLVQH